MNKVDIIRKHIGNDNFYDMNGTSMLTNILNAMEEYKKQEVKKISIPDVVNRRELLLAFAGQMQSIDVVRPEKDIEKYVDNFLADNCD